MNSHLCCICLHRIHENINNIIVIDLICNKRPLLAKQLGPDCEKGPLFTCLNKQF